MANLKDVARSISVTMRTSGTFIKLFPAYAFGPAYVLVQLALGGASDYPLVEHLAWMRGLGVDVSLRGLGCGTVTTEVHSGGYVVFMHAKTAPLSGDLAGFRHALPVRASVISSYADGRIVLDAGIKNVSTDGGLHMQVRDLDGASVVMVTESTSCSTLWRPSAGRWSANGSTSSPATRAPPRTNTDTVDRPGSCRGSALTRPASAGLAGERTPSPPRWV
jgi:hypothetical protein